MSIIPSILKPHPYDPLRWKKSFTTIFFAEMITMMGFSTSLSIIPFFLQQDLGVTDDHAVKIWNGLLAMVPAIGMALMAPLWGSLSDRYGRKLMLLRAMIIGGIIIAMMAYVQNSYQLLFLRLLQGCFAGSVAAATVLVATTVPRHAAAVTLGFLQVGIYIGNAVGPALGGLIFKYYGGRTNFLITSSIVIVSAYFVYKFVGEAPLNFLDAEVNKKNRARTKPTITPLLGYILIIVLFSQSAFSLTSAIMGLYVQFISPDLTVADAASTAGLVIALSAFASAIGATFFGLLGRKMEFNKILILCFAGCILTYIPQAISNSWKTLLYYRFINSIFIGGVMPAINAMLAFNSPKESQGTIFGFSSSLSSIAGALGPALGALIALVLTGVNGYRLVFIASALILLAITLSLISFKPKKE